jgi:hypothetical protein
MQLMLIINTGICGIEIGQDGILEFFEYLGFYMRYISWPVVIIHGFFALAHPMKPAKWTGVVTVLAFCSWVIYFSWLPTYGRGQG